MLDIKFIDLGYINYSNDQSVLSNTLLSFIKCKIHKAQKPSFRRIIEAVGLNEALKKNVFLMCRQMIISSQLIAVSVHEINDIRHISIIVA